MTHETRNLSFTVRRWFLALAIRLPGAPMPACIGLGTRTHERAARAAATELAERMLEAA